MFAWIGRTFGNGSGGGFSFIGAAFSCDDCDECIREGSCDGIGCPASLHTAVDSRTFIIFCPRSFFISTGYCEKKA